jgi:uncharacterized protein YpmS
MKIKRFIIIVLLFLGIVAFCSWIFILVRELKIVEEKNNQVSQKINELTKKKEALSEDIRFYSNPLNLQKLLREKFNYKLPYEKMIIVVPNQNSNQ